VADAVALPVDWRFRWRQLATTAALAVFLCALTMNLSGLFRDATWWPWCVWPGAGMIVALGLLRFVGVADWIGAMAGPVLTVCLVTGCFAQDRAFAYFLPTPGVVSHLTDLLTATFRTLEQSSAPVRVGPGLLLVLTLAACLAGWLLDLVAVALRLPALSAVIGAGALLVPAFFTPAGLTPWLVGAAAAAYLLVLWAGSGRPGPWRGRVGRGAPWAALARVAAAVAVVALVVWSPTPSFRLFSQPPLVDQLPATIAFGDGSSPLIDLGQDLAKRTTRDAVRVTVPKGVKNAPYLRVTSLEDYSGDTWRHRASNGETAQSGTVAVDNNADVPDVLTDPNRTIELPTTTYGIKILDMTSPWLPVPYPTKEIDGIGGQWSVQQGDGSIAPAGGAEVAGQSYHVTGYDLTASGIGGYDYDSGDGKYTLWVQDRPSIEYGSDGDGFDSAHQYGGPDTQYTGTAGAGEDGYSVTVNGGGLPTASDDEADSGGADTDDSYSYQVAGASDGDHPAGSYEMGGFSGDLPKAQWPGSAKADLALPKDMPASIYKTALGVTVNYSTPLLKAHALEAYFHSGAFTYSTTAPSQEGYDGDSMAIVARFLQEKVGYCIHFATAMVVMARSIGIPARVAIGYLPNVAGVPQADGSTQYTLTSAQLHSWPELYIAGLGWLGFEPTVGASPEYKDDAASPAPVQTVTVTPTVTVAPSPSASASGPVSPSPSGTVSGAGLVTRGADVSKGPSPGAGVTVGVVWGLPDWWPWALGGLVVVLLLALPGLLRRGRRRRRRRAMARGPALPALRAAWAEVADTAVDAGLGAPPTETPAEFEARVGVGLEAGAARDLTLLVRAVEAASFSSEPALAPFGFADGVAGIRSGLLSGVSRIRRIRSVVWPTSVFRRRSSRET
jgi:transglutaminase-like putative cysteine protease